MGNIFNPRNLSSNFSKLLELKGLRHIRFHDLRHSCASLLLANDVPMKQIQEWLGHSDISTTANIYSHLDYKSKLTSANVMDNVRPCRKPRPSDGRHDFLPKIMCSNGRLAKRKAQSYGRKALI